MDTGIEDKFSLLWQKHFNNVELPITFYYTDEEGHAERVRPGSVPRCLIEALSNVRKGSTLCFDADSIRLSRGKKVHRLCP